MATHQATEPRVVREHFARFGHAGRERKHAIVEQVFTPGKGWRDYPIEKRVSASWAREARSEGVTSVALGSAGRLADFAIEELTRRG